MTASIYRTYYPVLIIVACGIAILAASALGASWYITAGMAVTGIVLSAITTAIVVRSLRKESRTLAERAAHISDSNQSLHSEIEQYRHLESELRQEIEHHQQATDELRKSHEFIQDVIDGISDQIMVLDRDRRVVLANRATRELVMNQDPVSCGLKCHHVTHSNPNPCNGDHHTCPFDQVLATKLPCTVEHTHTSRDGTAVSVEVTMWPIFDERGEVIQVIENSRDVTVRREIEDALRRNQRSLARAQEMANIGSWDVELSDDPDVDEMTQWSPQVYRILGLHVRDTIASVERIIQSTHPEDRLRVQSLLAELRRTGQTCELAHRIIRPDGEERIVKMAAELVCDAFGMPVRMIGTIRDVTESRRHEQDLRNQKELLSNVLTTIPMLVFWKDTSLRYMGCNDAFANLTGLADREQVLDKKDDELPWSKELAGYFRLWDQRVLQDGEKVPDIETVTTGQDGKEVVFQTTKIPLRDVDGTIAGVLGVCSDITTRKEAEQQIMRIQAALDDAANPVMVTDRQERPCYMNVAFGEQFRCTPDTLAESGWQSLYTESTVADEIALRVQSGQSWNGETQMVSTEGTVFPAEVRATPIIDEMMNVAGMLLMITDLTERKRMEGQMLQTRKLESIGQLAAGIAHEINTPTQYIGDNTRFLQDSFNDITTLLDTYDTLLTSCDALSKDEKLTSAIQQAKKDADLEYLTEEVPAAITQALEGIERVAEIVRAMKEFSHPGVEGMTATDINQAIQSTITVARNEWKYIAEVNTELDESIPKVPCLVSQLNQVILNLVINATHAIAEKNAGQDDAMGTITIRTSQDGNHVVIEVIDSGCGIPDDVKDRIFDPFFTTKDVGQGTGQGLSIAYDVIVDKHGGTIDCTSTSGEGTTFSIRLPIQAENDEQEATIKEDVHVG